MHTSLAWSYRYVIAVLVFFFCLQGVAAACSPTPDEILVSSGSETLGSFQSGDDVYIHGNISSHPLAVALRFQNASSCFSGKDQFDFRLVPSGSVVQADEVAQVTEGETNYTEARYQFNLDIVAEDPFRSTFSVTTDDGASQQGTLTFLPDDVAPQLVSSSVTPSNKYVQSGENATLDFTVDDGGSALSLIRVSAGSTEQQITFDDRNNTYSGSFEAEMGGNDGFSIVAEDRLGNRFRETINVTVDEAAPSLDSVSLSYGYTGQHVVSVEAMISDDSFERFDTVPEVRANLSGIRSGLSDVAGTCERDNGQIRCQWTQIPIQAESSKSITLQFHTEDAAGRSMDASVSKQLRVDRAAPKITAFYFENGQGIRNMIGSGNEGTVVVRVTDASVSRGERVPRIRTSFGAIPFASRDCELLDNGVECRWQMEDALNVYEGTDRDNVTFRVEAVDVFTNSAEDSITVTIDNEPPEIKRIELIETESIKDGVLKSGEVIEFDVFVEDEHLQSGGRYFVTANFSSVDFSEGREEMEGQCTTYDENTTRCSFRGIELENGYLKRNVTFRVADAAGNVAVENRTLEILKIADEVVSSYHIPDQNILNPLNRDLVLKSGTEAWFEGTIEAKDPDMEILNYQLARCNESQLNPLLVVRYGLFPQEVVINEGQEGLKEFAMDVELKNQPNVGDLRQINMTCYMSILKRDDTKIYESEQVPFDLVFEFYDMPRGDLVEAHAKDILEMTNEINYLGGWFDSIVSIYDVLYGVCSAMSSANGLMAGVGQAWASIQYAYTTFTAGTSEVYLRPANQAIFGTQGIISDIYTTQPIKFICDWMTCRNGGPLGNVLLSAADSALGGAGITSSTETTTDGGSDILPSGQYDTGGEDTLDTRQGSGGIITGIGRAYDAACRMDFDAAGSYLGTNQQDVGPPTDITQGGDDGGSGYSGSAPSSGSQSSDSTGGLY